MGRIQVEPRTTLRMQSTRNGRHHVSLESGTVKARMWAPPFSLYIDTPSSTAIDLGCAFTLSADVDGTGELHVTSGWVEFALNDRQAIVPEGAMVYTRKESGPGTPFFEDAPPALRDALTRLDAAPYDQADPQTLSLVLMSARRKDVLSLLSLLRRLPREQRAAIFDRAAQLLPPPVGLTREEVLRGTNQKGMDDWWARLGFGNAKSWVFRWRDLFPT
jgi:hypothetical protein